MTAAIIKNVLLCRYLEAPVPPPPHNSLVTLAPPDAKAADETAPLTESKERRFSTFQFGSVSSARFSSSFICSTSLLLFRDVDN